MDGLLEKLRVLVVDDDPNIVDVVSMALRHNGFSVDATDTGTDALARARRWRPHVMLLDVMLPDMTGFEIARRLTGEHLGVPILFLSARAGVTGPMARVGDDSKAVLSTYAKLLPTSDAEAANVVAALIAPAAVSLTNG